MRLWLLLAALVIAPGCAPPGPLTAAEANPISFTRDGHSEGDRIVGPISISGN